jgi:hypothetical protein
MKLSEPPMSGVIAVFVSLGLGTLAGAISDASIRKPIKLVLAYAFMFGVIVLIRFHHKKSMRELAEITHPDRSSFRGRKRLLFSV